MSMDPSTMQQLLMSMQNPQAGSAGGGVGGGPAMQGSVSPMNAAATITQKLMLMRALQGGQQQQQANAMLPKTNAMIQTDPTMQALQTQPPQMPQAPVPQQ